MTAAMTDLQARRTVAHQRAASHTLDGRALALVGAVIGLRTQQVADALEVKRAIATKVLNDLEEAGRVKRTGSGAWEVVR